MAGEERWRAEQVQVVQDGPLWLASAGALDLPAYAFRAVPVGKQSWMDEVAARGGSGVGREQQSLSCSNGENEQGRREEGAADDERMARRRWLLLLLLSVGENLDLELVGDLLRVKREEMKAT